MASVGIGKLESESFHRSTDEQVCRECAPHVSSTAPEDTHAFALNPLSLLRCARTLAARAPAFTDDDYYPDVRLAKGGSPGDLRSMTTGYSDMTDSTFSQPPMSRAGESYNMSDMSSYDYSAALSARARGAAGVGAMGLNRARSTTQPYNAFAGPYAGALPLHRSASCMLFESWVWHSRRACLLLLL